MALSQKLLLGARFFGRTPINKATRTVGTTSIVDNSAVTSKTFNSVNIGSAHPARKIVIAACKGYVIGSETPTSSAISGVTINTGSAVAMTEIKLANASVTANGKYSHASCGIYAINQADLTDPTATTATIIVSGGTAQMWGIGAYAVLSYDDNPTSQLVGDTSPPGSGSCSPAIDRPVDAVAIGAFQYAGNVDDGYGCAESGPFTGTGDMGASDEDACSSGGGGGRTAVVASKEFSAADANYQQGMTYGGSIPPIAGTMAVAVWTALG